MWYWFETESVSWIEASKSNDIEDEYQLHLAGKRFGQKIYHCFGNGCVTCIDFNRMSTYCASAKCLLAEDHMTFNLRRD